MSALCAYRLLVCCKYGTLVQGVTLILHGNRRQHEVHGMGRLHSISCLALRLLAF